MGSESLFISCKVCAKEISRSARVCPSCGMRQSRLSKIHWIGIAIVGIMTIGIINSPDRKIVKVNNNSVAKEQAEPSTYEIAMRKVNLDFNWHKTGFDSIMEVDFTITNDSNFEIKDIEIECKHYAKSGTVIDRNKRTIFDIVPARSKKEFINFNMGFIMGQVEKTECSIIEIKI